MQLGLGLGLGLPLKKKNSCVNYLLNPTILVDANSDGIADNYSIQSLNDSYAAQAGITFTPTIDGGQKIAITGGTITGYVRFRQILQGTVAMGIVTGSTMKAGLMLKSPDRTSNLSVEYFTSAWGYITTQVTSYKTTADFEKIELNLTIPANTDKIIFAVHTRIGTIGNTGNVWCKDAYLCK